MTHTITVTQGDIDRGIQDSCSKCPVALTMSKAIGKVILVGGLTWSIRGELGQDYLLPTVARRWIANFDRDKSTVKPITFTVEVPE